MFYGYLNYKIAVHNRKTIQSLCCLEVQKLPNPVLTDFFFLIYLQSSIPIRPMAHPPPNVPASSLTQWTLFHCAWWVTSLLFLHLSIFLLICSPYLPQFHYYSKSHTGTQGRNRIQYKRPFSASRVFLESSLQSQAFSSLPCRVS